MSTTTPTLVVIGSGPGIAISFAKLFASRKFSKIALISRSATRLEDDRKDLLSSVSGREIEVKTWSVDITDTPAFKRVLAEVEQFGAVSCVLFNAARVAASAPLLFPAEEIMRDFATTNIALYIASCWAIPILNTRSVEEKPSLLVTSSLLWREPWAELFSLSMTKASQRNMVQSLAATYPDVHIALLNVAGVVSPEDEVLNPPAIAEKFWELYQQEKGKWALDLQIGGT